MATILLSQHIDASPEVVFQAFFDPQANLAWNHAGGGWTTPFAEIDARVGGLFRVGYASPDGKESFTFEGTFDEIRRPEFVRYTIADGRPVSIWFKEQEGGTHVELELTLENQNPVELQREGWGMILTHLAEYVEGQV